MLRDSEYEVSRPTDVLNVQQRQEEDRSFVVPVASKLEIMPGNSTRHKKIPEVTKSIEN